MPLVLTTYRDGRERIQLRLPDGTNDGRLVAEFWIDKDAGGPKARVCIDAPKEVIIRRVQGVK